MTHRLLSQADLAALVGELVAANTHVVAPVRAKDSPDELDYGLIRSLDEAAFGVALPRRSLKEFFLPVTEVLLHYRRDKEGVSLDEVPNQGQPLVIVGASPCDVGALEVVDKVMGWDYRDELWFGRRESTTVVTMLCQVMDEGCFCTSIGLGPEATRGSDVLLTPIKDGYLAEILTPKGEALLKGRGTEDGVDAALPAAEAAKKEARAKVEGNLPHIPDDFAAWLAKNFNNPVWKTIALRCHGCGACASVCPTCHCFDIVDEHDSVSEGVRRRNWDSCQTAKFTQHASGHNPRQSQTERFRQRIEHKFSVYPSRFGDILCTGCGRCSRYCPGSMVLPEIVGQLMDLAKAERSGQ